jgi:putative ABC transport system substrate-binding protein
VVASLARPGGNITGLATSIDDSTPKRLELLVTAVPKLSRVGFVWDSDNSIMSSSVLSSARDAAATAGLQVVPVDTRGPQDVESMFATLSSGRAEAILVAPNPFRSTQRQRFAELAIQKRMPTIFPYREFVEVGGLMSYGESYRDFNRRAAFYVDKIIKGAKPADLPVQQPTRFFLTINRKTADALGLTIPLELLVRADEIIE